MPDGDEPTGYDRSLSDEFGALINARLDEARALLTQATYGQPLCRIDAGADPRVEEIKSREGAAAALADLRNALEQDGPSGALDRVSAAWSYKLARHRARGGTPAWISYAQGGLAALDDLRSPLADEHT